MRRCSLYPFLQALLAAMLFGASAPLAKILLGEMDAIPMAGFLYLGSLAGALLLLWFEHLRHNGQSVKAHLTRVELPWLVGAMLAGGVAAPIALLLGLQNTPASTASLLLNFEAVATTLIAILAFKEAVDGRILWAIGLITLASILLSWNGGGWGISLGALGILTACLLWGLDNNFTRHISGKNPLTIVAVKGLGAGAFSLLLSLVLSKPLPPVDLALWTMLLGAFSYGLSIQLFIRAMRSLGAARTSALFGTAPFVGTFLAIVLLKEIPQVMFWISAPVMVAGACLMLSENHAHYHVYEPLEHVHAHKHLDAHQDHIHPVDLTLVDGVHSHRHQHEALAHSHAHTPDLHHRHDHEVVRGAG